MTEKYQVTLDLNKDLNKDYSIDDMDEVYKIKIKYHKNMVTFIGELSELVSILVDDYTIHQQWDKINDIVPYTEHKETVANNAAKAIVKELHQEDPNSPECVEAVNFVKTEILKVL